MLRGLFKNTKDTPVVIDAEMDGPSARQAQPSEVGVVDTAPSSKQFEKVEKGLQIKETDDGLEALFEGEDVGVEAGYDEHSTDDSDFDVEAEEEIVKELEYEGDSDTSEGMFDSDDERMAISKHARTRKLTMPTKERRLIGKIWRKLQPLKCKSSLARKKNDASMLLVLCFWFTLFLLMIYSVLALGNFQTFIQVMEHHVWLVCFYSCYDLCTEYSFFHVW